MTKMSEGETMPNTAIALALGLSEGATDEQVIETITEMQTNQFTENDRNALEALRYKDRVSHFMEEAKDLTVAPGTLTERATKLATIEADQGAQAATERLAEWQTFQDAATAAGVTQALLSPQKSDEAGGPATQKIVEYAKEKQGHSAAGRSPLCRE